MTVFRNCLQKHSRNWAELLFSRSPHALLLFWWKFLQDSKSRPGWRTCSWRWLEAFNLSEREHKNIHHLFTRKFNMTLVFLLLYTCTCKYSASTPPCKLMCICQQMAAQVLPIGTYSLLLQALQMPSLLWRWLIGRQEGHSACKNWVVRYWHGYLSGARCRWFAYGPAGANPIPSSLAPVKSRMVYLPGAGLPRLSWKKGH